MPGWQGSDRIVALLEAVSGVPRGGDVGGVGPQAPQRSSVKRSSEQRDPFGEEGNREEEPGFHEGDHLYGSGFAELQPQILEESSNDGLQATQLEFEKIIAEASVSASTPPGNTDDAMGMDGDEGEDVDDAEAAEEPIKVSPWYTEWLEDAFKEASPLQMARVKVNTIRIEIEQAEEKIAANEQGGPSFFTNFLQKNRDKKNTELESSVEALGALQLQADAIQKTQFEAAQATQLFQERRQALVEAKQQAAAAEEAVQAAKKLAEHAQQAM